MWKINMIEVVLNAVLFVFGREMDGSRFLISKYLKTVAITW